MKIEGNINYTLEIDAKEGQHNLTYENKMEHDIAALMISAEVLTIQLNQWKELKKEDGANKKAIGRNISIIAQALRGIKSLMDALLASYEDFTAHQHELMQRQEEALKSQNLIPKEE